MRYRKKRPSGGRSGYKHPTFPRYLQYAWDLSTLGGRPRGALRRALKRLQGARVRTA